MPASFIHLQYCYAYLVDQISVGLLIYSHIPAAVVALLLGGFLLFQSRKLPNVALFFVSLFFACWCFLDLGSWFAFLGSGTMMFTWSLADLFSPLFFFFTYYFLYAFLTGRDLPWWQKAAGILLILPDAYWIFVGQKLTIYDANLCEATENAFHNYYQFGIEGVFLLASLALGSYLYIRAASAVERRKTLLATTGVVIFLSFFLLATLGVNVLVSDTAVQFAYNFEIYGLFGMPVFIAYLGYLIVRYHAFDLKVFTAQALILALAAALAAEYAFSSSYVNQILISVTLILTAIIGSNLVRGVRREIEQREKIEQLAKELQETNERQEGLIHFIGHEVKGFLTKAEGAFAALVEGDFGALPPTLAPFVREALAQTREGLTSVSDILKASNQKKGTVAYKQEPFDLKELVVEAVGKARSAAEAKKLALTLHINEQAAHPFICVKEQF